MRDTKKLIHFFIAISIIGIVSSTILTFLPYQMMKGLLDQIPAGGNLEMFTPIIHSCLVLAGISCFIICIVIGSGAVFFSEKISNLITLTINRIISTRNILYKDFQKLWYSFITYLPVGRSRWLRIGLKEPVYLPVSI